MGSSERPRLLSTPSCNTTRERQPAAAPRATSHLLRAAHVQEVAQLRGEQQNHEQRAAQRHHRPHGGVLHQVRLRAGKCGGAGEHGGEAPGGGHGACATYEPQPKPMGSWLVCAVALFSKAWTAARDPESGARKM